MIAFSVPETGQTEWANSDKLKEQFMDKFTWLGHLEGKTKYYHVDESPELKELKAKEKDLENKLRELHCI